MLKVDMHLHSEFSERPSDWFLKRLGTKESYTTIDHIYHTAKERGMDFVTITDHNRIDGVLSLIEKYPNDVFLGVESTTYFPENGCKIHLLIYDFTPYQFQEIQTLRKDIYKLRDYLMKNNILCSVAHAAYSINNRLTVENLEKLILLFNNFEKYNASHNPIFNDIWISILENLNEEKIYSLYDKHGITPWGNTPWLKGFTGGSDDHSGLFIAKNHTKVIAKNKKEFIERTKLQLSIGAGSETDFKILPFMVYKIAWDFLRFEKRKGADLISALSKVIFRNKRRGIKSRFLRSSNISTPLSRLITELNRSINDNHFNFSNPIDLDRLYKIISSISDNYFKLLLHSFEKNIKRKKITNLIRNTSAMLPALFLTLPFYSNLKHINSNRELFIELSNRFQIKKNIKEKKVLWFSDTLNDINGVAENMKRIAKTANIENYSIKIVVCEEKHVYKKNILNIPPIYSFTPNFYNSNTVTIPSVLRAIELISREKPDQIVISTPGPVGFLGLLISKLLNIHNTSIYHTDFGKMAKEVFNDEGIEDLVMSSMKWFYNQADNIKVPSNFYINQLVARGYDTSKMSILKRGIDLSLFSPEKKTNKSGFSLVWAGRVGKEKNINFIYEIMKILKDKSDINLTIAGDGPELSYYKKLFSKLRNISFIGRQTREKLTKIYASSDLMIFPSLVDTFGMVVLEAQASGLPVIVSNIGGPQEIIIPGKTGYVLDTYSPITWAKKILEIMDLKENSIEAFNELKTRSRINAEKRFSWEGMIKDVIKV